MNGSSLVFVVLVASCGSVSEKPDASVPTVTVTVVKDGNGSGSITSSPSGVNCGGTCVAEFEIGAAVVLTATADADSVFMGWGGGCSGTNSCVFTANANNAISATFAKTGVTITVTKAGGGMGAVTSTPAGITCGGTCSAIFPFGSSVTLTATPNAGQNSRWSGGSCTGTGPCTFTANSVETITAQFTIPNMYLIEDSTNTFQKITNFTTPTLINVGPLGVEYDFGDCTYNSTDGMVYFVEGRPVNSLYRVNTTTGAATLVGAHGITDMFALGYHPPSNTLYGIGQQTGVGPTLYSISLTTGAATLIAATEATESLVWDSKRSRMVAASYNAPFRTIDLATGVQTPIPAAGNSISDNNGMTYDTANDLFWQSSYSAGMQKYDPNNNFTGTAITSTGPHTCIVYVP